MSAPQKIPHLKITLAKGEVVELDLQRLMLSEAIALEEHWDLTVQKLSAQLLAEGQDPPLRMVAALAWLAKVRGIAAAAGVTAIEAAKQLPVETFDINMVELQIELVVPGANPTRPAKTTRSPATRTTRGTSAKPRRQTTSPPSDSAT